MRQFNFVLIFVIALALVLFSLENTEPATIQVVGDIQFRAPLAVELMLAMGVGAVLAWIFSTWMRLLHLIESGRARREIRRQDKQIQKLEKDVEHYKAEVEILNQPSLPPATESTSKSGKVSSPANSEKNEPIGASSES